MKEIKRYRIDFTHEELYEDSTRGAVCYWRDVEKLQKELHDMTAKAIAAVWLMRDDATLTELQELRAHASEVLMGKDKQTITKLQDELANAREHCRRLENELLRRPSQPGVNRVYGTKAGDETGLHYILMLTNVQRGDNGGLEIEVQLP